MTEKLQNTETQEQLEVKTDYPVVHPMVDILEEKDAFILIADMPGLQSDDIELSLDKDVLSIEALSETDGLYPRAYARKFRVMRGIEADKIEADYKEGILTLKIAKPEETKPQKIKVQCC